ncbi:MAG: protein-glutamate O-methyltransferase CheR [Bacteroidota bacterium]
MRLLSNLSADTSAKGPQRLAGPRSLSPSTFEALRSRIYEFTGIYFQDNKQYLLESRLLQRLDALKLDSYDDYLAFLNKPLTVSRELPALYDAITINETYFFRNTTQFDMIAQQILPERAKMRMAPGGGRRLRLWSAACSTGDEPYTLALIALEQILPRFPGLSVEIVGTDLSEEVIQTAKAGLYSEYAVRNIPPAYLRKHFTKEGNKYVLSDRVRRMVQFRPGNLLEGQNAGRMRDIDLILCANVLIYFDQDSKQKALAYLHRSLTTGGYLLVGFSETLYGVTQAFRPVRHQKTIAYQKGGRHA